LPVISSRTEILKWNINTSAPWEMETSQNPSQIMRIKHRKAALQTAMQLWCRGESAERGGCEMQWEYRCLLVAPRTTDLY